MKLIDKNNTYIDDIVKIGKGTIIYPNVIIEGETIIGDNCTIYAGSYIKNSIIGDNNTIYSSYVIESEIGNNNNIGPFSNIRANNKIKDNNRIGAFVELKENKINSNNNIPHLSYIGDSIIESGVNIGCGTITANYDGVKKQQTTIKKDAFIGCDVTLVAPVTIGANSSIAAGSTITENVLENSLAIARKEQVNKKNYNRKKQI